MSWPAWQGGTVQPPMAGMPVVNPTPGAMPVGLQYTPEQWQQMQQQNWQQWAQWQQQYQQWHQQYGAEYQKSLSAMAGTTSAPIPPMPNMSAPPPAPEQKPPPPPEPEPTSPINPHPPAKPPTQNYTSVQPTPPPNFNQQNKPLLWKGQPNMSQPPPNFKPEVGMKRPFNNNQNNQNNPDFDSKRNKFDPNWRPPATPSPAKTPTSNPPPHPSEELSESEKKFMKQFAEWEAQFNKWKEQNQDHPDKAQYKQYEKKWEAWRNQLLERREQMRRRRLGLSGSTPENKAPTLTKQGLSPQSLPVNTSKPPPTVNNEPLQFKPKPSDMTKSDEHEAEEGSSFLESKQSSGIPGLDLAEAPDVPDRPEEKAEFQELQKSLNLEALTKNINNILGDQKLLSMLSMVTKNPAISKINSTEQQSSSTSNVDEISRSSFNQEDSHSQCRDSYSNEQPQETSKWENNEWSYNKKWNEGGDQGNPQNTSTNWSTDNNAGSKFGDNRREEWSNDQSDASKWSKDAPQWEGDQNWNDDRNPGQNYEDKRDGPNWNNDRNNWPNERDNSQNWRNDKNNAPNWNNERNANQNWNNNDKNNGPNWNAEKNPGPNWNNDKNNAPNWNENKNEGPNWNNDKGNAQNWNNNRNNWNAEENNGSNWENDKNNAPGWNNNRWNDNKPQANSRWGGNDAPKPRWEPPERTEWDEDSNNYEHFEKNYVDRGGRHDDYNNRNRGYDDRGGNDGYDNRGRNEDCDDRSRNDSFGNRGRHDDFVQNDNFDNRNDNNFHGKFDDFDGRPREEEHFENFGNNQDAGPPIEPQVENFEKDINNLQQNAIKTDLNEYEEVGMEVVSNENSWPEPNPVSQEDPNLIDQADDIMNIEKVIDYDHMPKKPVIVEVHIVPPRLFDYRHKLVTRIPLPERPKWLADTFKYYPEFEPIIGRIPPPYERYAPVERFDYRSGPVYQRLEAHPSYNRRPYDERRYFEERRHFDDRYERRSDFRDRPADFEPRRLVRESELKAEKSVKIVPKVANKTVMIDDILNAPGRFKRDPKILIILRGPPGSGKTFLAKLIKDKEVELGGSAPRILSLDDYFMVEQEKEIKEEGKNIKIKEMVYEYEEGMEISYKTSLLKSFKKTITDGYFPFIIVDNVNDKVKYFDEMWSFGKQNGFQVYVCQLELDVQVCTRRNTHNRSEKEIQAIVHGWETTPPHYLMLDATSLIQSGSIAEVEMEEINSPNDNFDDDDNETEEQACNSSKWDNFECSINNLAKLDGINKPLRASGTMEDYLQLDEWSAKPSNKPGQKRVRWADLEERKQQEKMRAIGFVVGQTDWERMMDPTQGGSALTKTKYFERAQKY